MDENLIQDFLKISARSGRAAAEYFLMFARIKHILRRHFNKK